MQHPFFASAKRLLTNLRHTPLHPQWLILRKDHETFHQVSKIVEGRLLDIGCGNRTLERYLPNTCSYIGLDYPKTVNLGYQGKPSVFGDGQNLPFASASFQCITFLDVLEHIPKPSLAIDEAWRVLSPAGILVIQVPFLYPLHDEPYDFQRWTCHGLEKLCQSGGFEVTQIHARNTPIATASALLTIALAKSMVDALTGRRLSVLLTPLIAMLIALINSLAFLADAILPASDMMPSSYLLIARKSGTGQA
jgi:SAM-dependent methyltransferase